MNPKIVFVLVLSIVILRPASSNSLLAKRNERWMRSQGAYKAGAEHYPDGSDACSLFRFPHWRSHPVRPSVVTVMAIIP